jgi:hypothetical protein
MDGSGEEKKDEHKKRPGVEALFHSINRQARWQRLRRDHPHHSSVKVEEK